MIRGYDKVLCVKQTGEQLFQMTRDSRRAQISRRCLLISGDQVQEACEIAGWNFGFTVGRKSSHHSISMIYMHHFYVFLDVGICPVYMCPYYTMLLLSRRWYIPHYHRSTLLLPLGERLLLVVVEWRRGAKVMYWHRGTYVIYYRLHNGHSCIA